MAGEEPNDARPRRDADAPQDARPGQDGPVPQDARPAPGPQDTPPPGPDLRKPPADGSGETIMMRPRRGGDGSTGAAPAGGFGP
ncbi:hypothetical protein ACFV5C_38550, partial [Streptomyces sp. NPDC059762]